MTTCGWSAEAPATVSARPAVGAYVTALMDGGRAEPQFGLVAKQRARAEIR